MPLTRRIKLACYRAGKAFGLFRLARLATRRRVRILAYHGFSVHDEHRFRPKLFMSPETFARRMKLIADHGYRVVALNDAVARLSTGEIDPDTVVITIDDGFARTLTAAAPVLRQYGYPATVYLTTRDMQSQFPVFDAHVGYLCWKALPGRYELEWPGSGHTVQVDLSNGAAHERAYGALLELGEAQPDDASRRDLANRLAEAFSTPDGAAATGQAFRLLDSEEAKGLFAHGLDIGLHTHRHRFPPGDPSGCARELADNEAALAAMQLPHNGHFCYPSGVLGSGQVEVLQAHGLKSATTCELGLARRSHHPMRLPRILDGEDVTDIEFEAELSGFSSLLRQAFGCGPMATTGDSR